LHLAGGFAAVTLFGVLPALMIWVLKKRSVSMRFALLLVLLASSGIFLLELAQEIGLIAR
jgi:hypothetical protein